MMVKEKLICPTCAKTVDDLPMYDENIKGKIELLGCCYKCSGPVYKFTPNKKSPRR